MVCKFAKQRRFLALVEVGGKDPTPILNPRRGYFEELRAMVETMNVINVLRLSAVTMSVCNQEENRNP